MKLASVMALLCLGLLGSCSKKKGPTPPMTDEPTLHGTARAAAAAARVTPGLDGDLAAAGWRVGDPVFIRAFKEEGQLELWIRHGATGVFGRFRTYPIVAASGRLGPKLAEGDQQVPEGFYTVPPAGMNPESRFHLAFNIGYPNGYDLAHHRTGSAIMVHGGRKSIGCLAMTDEKMEEIYTLCAAAHAHGQAFFRIHLFPFRMTAARMAKAVGDPNEEFWNHLKEGYDAFESSHVPPEVDVFGGRYRVQKDR